MGISVFPTPSTGTSGTIVKIQDNTAVTMGSTYGTVTANVSVPAGTYIAYKNGSTGTQWVVNTSTLTTPSDPVSTVTFTTTGTTFIINYDPGTQLTWNSSEATPKMFLTSSTPMVFGNSKYIQTSDDGGGDLTSAWYYSTDAVNWTRGNYIPDGTDSSKVLAYNTTATTYQFVHATTRKIHCSTDGINWTNTYNDSPTISNFNCITTSNTNSWKYLIAHTSGTISVSTSGASWTTRSGIGQNGSWVTAGGGNDSSLFLLGTDGNYSDYYTSTNTVTWTNRTKPGIFPVYYYSYVNSKYWASSYGGVYSSTDAITWTLESEDAKNIASINYKDSTYWACDNQHVWTTNAKKIWKSTNGTVWSVVASTEKVNGLLNDGTRLITHTGSHSSGVTSSGYPRIYISTSGTSIVKGGGEITLVPVSGTPTTAS